MRQPAPASVPPRRLRGILCLDDFEAAARRVLPRPIFGYVSSASESGWSARRNREDFATLGFVPGVLAGVAGRSPTARVLDHAYDVPAGIAPMGICALSAYQGDLAMARAAARLNAPMVLSSSALTRLEEVIQVNPQAWFQAYLSDDLPATRKMLDRTWNAGFRTLVLTVDTPAAPSQENYLRAGFVSPLRPSWRLLADGLSRPRWLAQTFCRTLLGHGLPHFENNRAERGAPIVSRDVARNFPDAAGLDWACLASIRRIWKGPLVLKGILNPKDAARAAAHGADGIIVSNHGGRQLDGAVSAISALPAVAAQVPHLPVMLDGGVRRGTDVLKAFGLGARLVFIGRPFNYAIAVAGEAGAAHAFQLIRAEVMRGLAMLGARTLEDVRASGCVVPCAPPSQLSLHLGTP